MGFILATMATAQTQKTQIMILGTYHFHNPGADMIKMELDDHLSPKRQEQILAVVDKLQMFKPNKIAIERTPDDRKYRDDYRAYLKDQFTLTANEVHQIGFRLARRLGQAELYQVDNQIGLEIEAVLETAKKNNDRPFLEYTDTMMKRAGAFLAEISNKTVEQNLLEFAKPETLAFSHEFYLFAARVGSGASYPGADMVTEWYRRNLRIFANVIRASRPGDRVLLIIGGGHAPILRDLVKACPDLELIEPSQFLK